MLSKTYARAIGLVALLVTATICIADLINTSNDSHWLQPMSHVITTIILVCVAAGAFQYGDKKEEAK